MIKRFIILTIALALLAAVTYWLWQDEGATTPSPQTTPTLPRVAVTTQTPREHQAALSAYGRLTPRWSVTLTAAVSGTVSDRAPQLLVGQHVEKGQPLLRLDNPEHAANVAVMRQQLAEAKVQQQQLQQTIRQIRRDWKASRVKGNRHVIAIHKARNAAAEQAVNTATAQLHAAQTTLKNSRVSAPFAGVIRSVAIAPGQRIEQGEALLTLSEQQHLQLAVSLDARQFQRLAADWRGQRVALHHLDGQPLATATLRDGQGWVDSDTGLYPFFLDVTVDADNPQLPPAGLLVKAILPAKTVPRSVVIPDSAYTRDQRVWYVDAAQRLRFFTPTLSHREGKTLLVQLPSTWTADRIAVATLPLSDWIAGMPVEALESPDGTNQSAAHLPAVNQANSGENTP